MKVDLPEPDGPMTATHWPVWGARADGRRCGARPLARAGDDILAFLDPAGDDLGEVAVGDAELDGNDRGLTVRAQEKDAPRTACCCAAAGLLRHLLVILTALVGRQDAAYLLAAGLPDLLALDAALALGRIGHHQRPELVAALLEDGFELLHLLGGQAEGFHESVADLLEGRRRALRPGRPGARGGRGLGGLTRGAVAERCVRQLEDAVLLVHDKADIGRHAGEELED